MDKIKTPNHLLNALIPHLCNREHDYTASETTIIRTFIPLIIDRSYCRTKLCGDFVTYIYILLTFTDTVYFYADISELAFNRPRLVANSTINCYR
jgi:hypothetical protein